MCSFKCNDRRTFLWIRIVSFCLNSLLFSFKEPTRLLVSWSDERKGALLLSFVFQKIQANAPLLCYAAVIVHDRPPVTHERATCHPFEYPSSRNFPTWKYSMDDDALLQSGKSLTSMTKNPKISQRCESDCTHSSAIFNNIRTIGYTRCAASFLKNNLCQENKKRQWPQTIYIEEIRREIIQVKTGTLLHFIITYNIKLKWNFF